MGGSPGLPSSKLKAADSGRVQSCGLVLYTAPHCNFGLMWPPDLDAGERAVGDEHVAQVGIVSLAISFPPFTGSLLIKWVPNRSGSG